MKRRDFIALAGGAAAAWPVVARAQQAGSLPRIGFLGPSTPMAVGPLVAAFVQRLRELGWRDGQNVLIEYRWADGQYAKLGQLASELDVSRITVRKAIEGLVQEGLLTRRQGAGNFICARVEKNFAKLSLRK